MLKFGDLKYAYPDPHICYFCVVQNFLYLKLKICMFMGQFIGYTMIFYNFFKTHKYDFYLFLNSRITSAQEHQISVLLRAIKWKHVDMKHQGI
jgi:hypothetical protein